MNIILMGPPGAGKGTQAEYIVKELNIPHISTGDAFRQAMSEKTAMGLKAQSYVDQGLLVPDDITIGIVKERLEQPDCAQGFLLDGFPRTISQADALATLLSKMNRKLDHVFNISVERKQLLARLTGRRLCKECGATFHIEFNPSRNGDQCDRCSGELYQRADDAEERVATRLDEYLNKTAPLLEYYQTRQLLREIDGEQSISDVKQRIRSLLRGQSK